MIRLTLLIILLAALVGCASSYRNTRPYVPYIQMDSVIVTPEVTNG